MEGFFVFGLERMDYIDGVPSIGSIPSLSKFLHSIHVAELGLQKVDRSLNMVYYTFIRTLGFCSLIQKLC